MDSVILEETVAPRHETRWMDELFGLRRLLPQCRLVSCADAISSGLATGSLLHPLYLLFTSAHKPP